MSAAEGKTAAGMRIGLTGGIGAGKSTVSARLKRLGAMVLDADIAARQAVEPGSEGLALLVRRYGEGMLQQNGELDRRALAKKIFSNEEERLAVNALLHPLIQQRMLEQEGVFRDREPSAPVFWDVPLLIESGMHALMDEVWLVTASEEARVRRVMLRDGCSENEARSRMASQMPEAGKFAYASRILDNSGDQTALFKQVDALYRSLADMAR
jgi:dephospho-CoA kinase